MVLKPRIGNKLSKRSLTSVQCYNAVTDALSQHLPIKINGSLTVKQFFTQLVCLSSHKESIHSSSKLFSNYLSETALRHHLRKFDIDSLMSVSSDLLLKPIKHHFIPGKKYACAIDYTNDPYYGNVDENNEKYVIFGQNKKSTHKSYAYATLSIIEKNEKFTLAVLPVEKGKAHVNYVRELLGVLEKYQIKPEVLCMDGGFYIVDVMKYLIDKKIPFIIPAPHRLGRISSHMENSKKQQKYDYVVGKGHKNKVKITLGILVKKSQKTGKDKITYALYGVENWPMKKIAREYRHRFSIEATYRIRNEIKPKTSTKNATIRYLFALISFLIENIWVSFQISFFTKKQRGHKIIEEDKFPLSLFLILLNEKLRVVLKSRREVEVIT